MCAGTRITQYAKGSAEPHCSCCDGVWRSEQKKILGMMRVASICIYTCDEDSCTAGRVSTRNVCVFLVVKINNKICICQYSNPLYGINTSMCAVVAFVTFEQ